MLSTWCCIAFARCSFVIMFCRSIHHLPHASRQQPPLPLTYIRILCFKRRQGGRQADNKCVCVAVRTKGTHTKRNHTAPDDVKNAYRRAQRNTETRLGLPGWMTAICVACLCCACGFGCVVGGRVVRGLFWIRVLGKDGEEEGRRRGKKRWADYQVCGWRRRVL